MKKLGFSIIILTLLFIMEPVFPKAKDSTNNNYRKNQSIMDNICSNIINNLINNICKVKKSLKKCDKGSIKYTLAIKRLDAMRKTLEYLTKMCRKGIAPALTKTLPSLYMQQKQTRPVPGRAKSKSPGKNPGRKIPTNNLKVPDLSIKPVKAQSLPSPGRTVEYPEIPKPARAAQGHSSTISEKGVELIAKFEGSVRNSQGKHIIYNDQGGLPTIGYGHLITNPIEKSEYRNGITESQALSLFKDDIARFENAVRSSLTVKVSQAQFDALVSMAYNIGIGAFTNSDLLRLINARAPMSEIESEWKLWNKVTIGGVKQVSQGLKRRRELEWRLYSTEQYGQY